MRIVGFAAAPAVPLALYMAFIYAPTEAFMGDVQRIMYVHVPAAFAGYLGFLIVFVSGILFLRSAHSRWDVLAEAAAEVGILFTTITLLTGSIWARQVWGWWWTWDPRLTTTLVLWFVFVAYLVLRQAIDDPERGARFAAVFGIIGFLNVPLVNLSVTWWRSIHPPNFGPGPASTELAPEMRIALLVCMIAMLLAAVFFTSLRFRLGMAERRLARALEADS